MGVYRADEGAAVGYCLADVGAMAKEPGEFGSGEVGVNFQAGAFLDQGAMPGRFQYVQAAMSLFDQVTLALVGIGAVEPSDLLADSGNIFGAAELATLRGEGAVGDILLHFFDENGRPVQTPLDQRVVSMSLAQIRQADRAVGVAGGRRKYEAILGALRGEWINVLVTDCRTAERLLERGDA